MTVIRLLKSFALVLLVMMVGACTTTKVVSSSGGQSIQQARIEPYDGPKMRIAVQDFTFKAAKGSNRLGQGMSDMLADSLFNTGRFIVLEREHIEDVLAEQDFGASGRVDQRTAAPIGQIEGAQLLIRGSVIQENCRGGAVLLIGANRACMAINLRIIDARSGRVVNATTVEGTSADAGVGLVFATNPMPVGLGMYNKTPMERAVRNTIEAAVRHIVNTKL